MTFTSQTKNRRRAHRSRGFSLVELLIVVTIIFCVSVVALPNTLQIIATFRARGSMSGMSGVVQQCRSLAISRNHSMSVHFGTTSPGEPVVYAEDAASTASLSAAAVQMVIGRGVVRYTTLSGPNVPTTLTGAKLWGGLPDPVTTDVSFNSRGLPCSYNSSTGECVGNAFVYYFTYQPPFGTNGWAAISVSPAGRVKTWIWTGNAWSN